MSNPDNQVRISRRHLLKLIAAAGGGLGASLILPSKWVKPVMRTGVLPVHAQTSQVAKATQAPVPTQPPVVTKYDIVNSTEVERFDDITFTNYLDLTVTIQSAGNGIAMQATYQPYDSGGAALPVSSVTLTGSTSAGVATFTPINLRPLYDINNIYSLHITYSFATAAECSTTCTRQAVYLLPM